MKKSIPCPVGAAALLLAFGPLPVGCDGGGGRAKSAPEFRCDLAEDGQGILIKGYQPVPVHGNPR